MDIHGIIGGLRRRQSDRTFAEALSIYGWTTEHYRVWATEQGSSMGRLPAVEPLHQPVQEATSNAPPAAVHSPPNPAVAWSRKCTKTASR